MTFRPLGLTVTCADGESIFEVAEKAGRRLPSACGARATCGLCRVTIVDGDRHLSTMNADEQRHLGNVYFVNRTRLACQARVAGGDVTVELPP